MNKNVRGGTELEQGIATLRILEIQHGAALVAISRHEDRPHPRRSLGRGRSDNVAFRRLDLQNISTEIAEHLRCIGTKDN